MDEILPGVWQLLELPFDSLLFAHGDPIIGSGKDALRDFAGVKISRDQM